MSDILGDDFSLDLDEILEPENLDSNPDEGQDGNEPAGGGEPAGQGAEPATSPSTDGDDDDDGIDLSFATQSDEPEEDEKPDEEEPELKDTKDTKDSKDSTGRDPEGSPSSTISAFASALFEQGAFPDIDEEELKAVKTAEDLIALNKKQIEANEFRDLTPLQREALDAFRAGIDPALFAETKSRELQYESIVEEQLDNKETAKQLMTDYLVMNNTPEDVVKDLIESYDVDDKLVEKAKAALPKIKEKIKAENQQRTQMAKQQREETIKSIRSTLDNTKEILKGVAITEKERRELFNQMTQPAKVLDDGTQLDYVMVKRQEDPLGFMTKLHYYAKLGLFDKEVKTELIQRKAKTSALKSFEEQINQGNSGSRPSGGITRRPGVQETDLYSFDEVPDVKLPQFK